MSDLFDLTGEMGLITGAGGQLGYEHAFALLEKNASVVLCDVSLEGLKQNQSRLISFFPNGSISHKILDVTNEENIKLVQNEFPAITILINNAAINPKISKLASNAFESYDLEKLKDIDLFLIGSKEQKILNVINVYELLYIS